MELAAGHRAREAALMQKLAWVTAHLLLPHTKRGTTITPAMLLGETPVSVEDAVTAAYEKQAARGTHGAS